MVRATKINKSVKLFGNSSGNPAISGTFTVTNHAPLPISPDPQVVHRMPEQEGLSIDRVVSLMPGFIYVFNHLTFANDYTNRSVGAHLGYCSEEISRLGAQMLTHVIHPDDHAILGAHMERIAALENDDSATLEYRVITKDGAERWLRSVDTVFERSSDGSVLRHIGCASDVTAEKQAELALFDLNAQLESKVAARTRELDALNSELESRILSRTLEMHDALNELEQLTYVATHDLKVPVNNLNRLGLMLKEAAHTLSPEQEEQVNWVNECAAQLGAKIKGLVMVAQIRLGSGLPPERLVLHDFVREVVAENMQPLDCDEINVTVDIDEDMTLEFARFELSSILATLLDNAVKYADRGRPLEIAIHAKANDAKIALSVADNGTGLDPERDKEKVFGLFQRAHKEPAGSGISLYCAQRMLVRRGGALELAGMRGEGAKFTVVVPKKGQTA